MNQEAERGSATVINLAIIACTLIIGVGLIGANAHLGAQSYATGVADIAALAAATTGECQAAIDVVARHTKYPLRMDRCVQEEGHAQIRVIKGGVLAVEATSRAGPSW
ncbi:MAG TPA: hypothetical protein VK054_04345 [Beutenbergiaceae bacterium]|nr:hypothetical protein [Beutenbergiaceae bacterium]